MKRICFSIPCYNEQDNIKLVTQTISKLFERKYSDVYEYVIEYIDNYSTDNTRNILIELCDKYPNNVKAIFNSRNFGGVSSFYGLLQSEGDCTIVLPCDFQIPISVIDEMLEKWEQGAHIVCAVKESSKENGFMWNVRKCYYEIVQKYSEISQIEHFTGSGLYDKKVVRWLNSLDDPIPSLRGMVAEYGCNIEKVLYVEERRKRGKSKHNFSSLFSIALKNIIIYTDLIPNIALCLGLGLCMGGGICGLICFIIKLCNWSTFTSILPPLIFVLMIMFGVQFLLMGLMGRYLSTIHKRILNRPLVIEEKRINF